MLAAHLAFAFGNLAEAIADTAADIEHVHSIN